MTLTLSNCTDAGDMSGYMTLSDADGGSNNSMLLGTSGIVNTADLIPFARVLIKTATP